MEYLGIDTLITGNLEGEISSQRLLMIYDMFWSYLMQVFERCNAILVHFLCHEEEDFFTMRMVLEGLVELPDEPKLLKELNSSLQIVTDEGTSYVTFRLTKGGANHE